MSPVQQVVFYHSYDRTVRMTLSLEHAVPVHTVMIHGALTNTAAGLVHVQEDEQYLLAYESRLLHVHTVIGYASTVIAG